MTKYLIIRARYDDQSPELTVFTTSSNKNYVQHSSHIQDNIEDNEAITTVSLLMSAKQASCFQSELDRSHSYKKHVIRFNCRECTKNPTVLTIDILLKPVHSYPIDYKFGKEIQTLVNEAIELDHIMSGLSTLGGAFSSLGDEDADFALMAGRISGQQYKIAVKLGNPFIIMRCQLYYSISLIQCNRLREARRIIQSVFWRVNTFPKDNQDHRIKFMCLGIWAKLKYVWHLKRNTQVVPDSVKRYTFSKAIKK